MQLTLGSAVLVVARAATMLVVARLLGPAQQGSFVLTISIVSLLGLMMGMGLQYANAYTAGVHRRRASVLLEQSLFMWGVAMLTAPAFVLLAFIFFPLVAAPFGEHQGFGIMVVALAVGAVVLKGNRRAVETGAQEFALLSKSNEV